jgi:hypothetical protein
LPPNQEIVGAGMVLLGWKTACHVRTPDILVGQAFLIKHDATGKINF